MVRKLSTLGVLEWSDHDELGEIDTSVVTDAINRASEEVFFYLGGFYSAATLATSELIMSWATMLACYYLGLNRGMAPPDGLQIEYDNLMKRLEQIRSGRMLIPGLSLSADLRPAISNLTVDRRYARDTIRVTRSNSTSAPTTLSQDRAADYPGID